MRIISEVDFVRAFTESLVRANFELREDMTEHFRALSGQLLSQPEAGAVAGIFLQNVELAKNENRAICQDTGYVQVYIEFGNEVQIPFSLSKTINRTIAEVYDRNRLRKSIAGSVDRKNTGDNTPAFIHYDFVDGDTFHVQLMLKGGGSENVTKAGYLLPTAGTEQMVDWVSEAVKSAGAKGCPPYLLGVGIGGTLEKALHYSKRLLLNRIGESRMNEEEAALAAAMLAKTNLLKIGFQGMGFGQTVLSVQVKTIPCHIATLPIAVSIGCNAVRQGEFRL